MSAATTAAVHTTNEPGRATATQSANVGGKTAGTAGKTAEKAEEEKKKQEEEKKKQEEQKMQEEEKKKQEEERKKLEEEKEKQLELDLASQKPDEWEQSVQNSLELYDKFMKNKQEKERIDWNNDQKLNEYLKSVEFPAQDYVEGKLIPTGVDIAIISASDNNGNRTKLSMAMQNRNEYAKKWNYRSYFVNLENFKGGATDSDKWLKVAAIKEVYETVPDAKWYFWLDSDIIIMNPDIDMASHVLHPNALAQRIMYGTSVQGLHREPLVTYPNKDHIDLDKIDIILSKDKYSIQTGALFFRRSDFITEFLQLWDDPALVKMGFQENEQDALLYLALRHPALFKRIGLVPQRLLNPYPHYDRSDTGTFQEGDFMVHFPGDIKNDDNAYNAAWEEWWAKRKRVEEQYREEYKEY